MKARDKKMMKLTSLLITGLFVSSSSFAVVLDTSIMSVWERMSQSLTGVNSPLQNPCPPERSHWVGTSTNVGATCRGENDNFEKSVIVNNPADYILSKNVLEARNIKNGRFDSYCKYIGTNNKWNQVNSGSRATVQDLINYQCSQNSFSCSDNLERKLRDTYQEQYEKEIAKIRSTENRSRTDFRGRTASENFPDADKFFDQHLSNAKFYDANGGIVKIPKELLVAIMHEESKGVVYHRDPYDWGLGLFSVRRATRNVQVDPNTGAVIEAPGAGNLADENLNKENSLYSPIHNLEKFIHVFQLKYNDFQAAFNGANGSLNFSSLSKQEQFKFVLTSLQMGSGNIFKSYDRMVSFNKAMNCNSCEAFKKQGSSCGTLRTSCSAPVANKCGKTVPENFDILIRFSNFTAHESNPEFQEHFSCSKQKLWPGEMGADSVGPCNLALTKSKTYRIMAGYQCAI
ncbi:MAG: hypothetical protein EP326_06355 [Deltaproteobacteria bacterium]|nr:MAG: hypothetical protein EP326_06355 [Deltaproteobacteria bacterium]TNF31574.1 MAG: hypothetical protein EP319_01885 [Deltaproteobacteria bacterium]